MNFEKTELCFTKYVQSIKCHNDCYSLNAGNQKGHFTIVFQIIIINMLLRKQKPAIIPYKVQKSDYFH